jgi:uncharacterized protein (TIGR03437 family)
MRVTAPICFALLISTTAMASSPALGLGVDYSEWLPPNVWQMAADRSGTLYILSECADSGIFAGCVTKLSGDGQTILWQNHLGHLVGQMAVDPSGGVYVIPSTGDTSIYVEKLSATGTGLAWKTQVGVGSIVALPVLASDSQGRTYIAGIRNLSNDTGSVVRLSADGTAVDYTAQVNGIPSAIAVDDSGAAFVAGSDSVTGGGFIARLAPDGSAGFYSKTVPVASEAAIAVDANGNAEVYGDGVLQRFDSTGALTFSKTIVGFGALALDATGNAYVPGYSRYLYAVKNSLATCQSSTLLSAFAPDGSVLQTTYVPGAGGGWSFIAAGPGSTVFVVATAINLTPTQAGPFPAGESGMSFLLRLSPHANAQTFPLACLGNAATFGIASVAPGEIITLSGNGLGPQQGVQTSATLQNPYPTQAAGVEVTFDGTPAPLLWVQDSQINAIAPWSLTPGQTTQICVTYNNVKTNCLAWWVAETAPGIFTVDGVYAAAVNQDGTINSVNHPAPVGSIVAVWATGLGPISPAQADGTIGNLPLPSNVVLPVGVQAPNPISKPCYPGYSMCQPPYLDFAVMYAGPAPYMVAGVSQINFQVVDYAPAGAQTNTIFVTSPLLQSQGFQIYYVAGQ